MVELSRNRLAFTTVNARLDLNIPEEKMYSEVDKRKINGKWCIVNGIGRKLENSDDETSDCE